MKTPRAKRLSLALAAVCALGLGVQPFTAATAATSTTTTTTVTADPSNLTYPARGRGGWPASGNGGTLSYDGLKPGRFYKSSAGTLGAPGRIAYRAMRDGSPVSINDYAVHRAVLAIQSELRAQGYTSYDGKPLVLDGLWGPKVDSAVKKFQAAKGLKVDGVFGPASAKAMFLPLVHRTAATIDPAHKGELARIMIGTITWESGWDPGAVGGLTPKDMGLGQINGPAHPSMNVNDRLDPNKSLPYVAKLVQSNLIAFGYRLDEAVAAYNLGQGGARSWVRAGKPRYWPPTTTNDIHRYIDKILNPPA